MYLDCVMKDPALPAGSFMLIHQIEVAFPGPSTSAATSTPFPAHVATRVFRRLPFERLPAPGRTEVILLPLMLGLSCSLVRVDLHMAHRVSMSMHAVHLQLPSGVIMTRRPRRQTCLVPVSCVSRKRPLTGHPLDSEVMGGPEQDRRGSERTNN